MGTTIVGPFKTSTHAATAAEAGFDMERVDELIGRLETLSLTVHVDTVIAARCSLVVQLCKIAHYTTQLCDEANGEVKLPTNSYIVVYIVL